MELTGNGLELDEVEANGIARVCDAVKRLGINGVTIEGRPPTSQERVNAERISDLLVSTFGATDGALLLST